MGNFWYVGSTKYAAITKWRASTSYAVGKVIQPLAIPNGLCYVCTKAGNSGAGGEPGWYSARGSVTAVGTALFQEATGMPALNGDSVNTPSWAPGAVHAMGDIIKNVATTPITYFICSYPGTSKTGTEPTWNKTGGAKTTTDGTVTWTSLGPITNFKTAWAAPASTIEAVEALYWGADGDTFYISNNHAQTTLGSVIILGSAGLPCYYLCVNDSVAPPTTLATTATSTGTDVTFGGNYSINYTYGISWILTNSPGASGQMSFWGYDTTFERCTFNLSGDGAATFIGFFSGVGGKNTFINTNVKFGAATQYIRTKGDVTFRGGSIAATGAIPAVLFDYPGNVFGTISLLDMDMSNITGTLFQTATLIPTVISANLQNCKLGSGVTIATPFFDQLDNVVLQNCSSTSNNYQFYTTNYCGTTQSETTTTRTGGAPVSWRVTTTAKNSYAVPLAAEEIAIWNDALGASITATIELAGSITLNTNDIWVEFEYLGSSGAPLGSLVNTKPSFPTTNTAIPTSSASWTGSPAVKQKLSASFTPNMPGVVKARIYIAKVSATLYIDPYITLSNGAANRRQHLLPGFGNMNETAQGEFSSGFVA